MNKSNQVHNLLVIDDEKEMCNSLKKLLEKNNFNVHLAHSAREGLNTLQQFNINLVICDIIMPDMGGLLFLSKIGDSVPIIMMTAYSSVQSTRKAFKLGARDYLVKPFDFEELLVVINQNLKSISKKEFVISNNKFLKSKNKDFINILSQADKFSETDMPILICGESGTGKEVLADYIHERSRRKLSPYVKINCAAIPDSLLESELFGYEKGAFTGAYDKKPGKFEKANGGTIFLDEIGDMVLPLQAKLLRVLQDFKFARLGGQSTIHVNVRIISSSNRDLLDLVKEEKFRKDLFHRLNGVYLQIPALREREEDIEEIAYFFVHQFKTKYNKEIERIDDKTINILKNYNWPGNIRELKNFIERAVVVCDNQVIKPEHLPDNVKNTEMFVKEKKNESFSEKAEFYRNSYMRKLIIEALNKTNGNRAEAAKILKISRKTLYNWMKELGITHEFI